MTKDTADYKFKTIWLSFSLCDEAGQYVNGFAIELHAASLDGMINRDLTFDLTHTDGTKERITLKGVVSGRSANITAFYRLGTLKEYVAGVRMTGEFPANMPISREKYWERCGVGKTLNASGHYV